MTNAWFGDWYERIKQRVREHGFDTITAFVYSQPTASLLELADELGQEDVAAFQLQKMLVAEAEETDAVERCARSLLVRNLHEELPEGWHTEWDDDATFRRASAYGAWYAAFPDRYDQALDRVGDALMAAPIPAGWLPAGPDAPILLEAFRHWDEPA